MKSGKVAGLVIAGFFLSVILFIIISVGFSIATGGLLVGLIFESSDKPLEPEIEVVSFQTELSKFLDETKISSIVRIPEEELNRMLLAFLSENIEDEDVSIEKFSIDIEPENLNTEVGIAVQNRGQESDQYDLKTLRTIAQVGVELSPVSDGIRLRFSRLRAGRLSLPLFVVRRLTKEFPLPEGAASVKRLGPLTFFFPYSELEKSLPQFVKIRRIEAKADELVFRLSVAEEAASSILEEAAPVLQREGRNFKAALQKELGGKVSEGELRKTIAAADELIALADALEAKGPDEPNALISYVENDVRVSPKEGESFGARIGDKLFSGAGINTGPASFAELILLDDSVIKIGEHTSFILQDLPLGKESQGLFKLESGTLRAKITKMISGDSSFDIRTPSATCGVRGTDLSIFIGNGRKIRVSVFKGQVVFRPDSGPETVLNANESLEVSIESLEKGIEEAIEASELSEKERQELMEKLEFLSSYEDRESIRVQSLFLGALDNVKQVAATIVSLNEESQMSLYQEVRRQVDFSALERDFNQLMENPQFNTMMQAYGIEELPLE